MTILLASNNIHKLNEINDILTACGIIDLNILTPEKVVDYPYDVVEDGLTFEENAFKKSDFLHKLTSLPTIADDSGLEVAVLNGQPGVMSARFSGEHGNDSLNRKKILELLSDVDLDYRKARFRTVICLRNGDLTKYFEGVCEGGITFFEKGSNGFGYDSIFIPEGYQKTFAEMSPEEKNKISHRGCAIKILGEYLKIVC